MGPSRLASIFSRNSSYRERFLARARKQGIAVSQGSWRGALRNRLGYGLSRLGYAPILAPAMTLLLGTVALLGDSLRHSNSRYTALAPDMAALKPAFAR